MRRHRRRRLWWRQALHELYLQIDVRDQMLGGTTSLYMSFEREAGRVVLNFAAYNSVLDDEFTSAKGSRVVRELGRLMKRRPEWRGVLMEMMLSQPPQHVAERTLLEKAKVA